MHRYVPPAAALLAFAAVVPFAFGQRQTELGEQAKAVVNGNNQFAYDLYDRLSEKEGNLFFSPYSISAALGMTYAGARGETADEMARVLHFILPQKSLNPAFGEVIASLNDPKRRENYQLNVANALWAQKGYPFSPDFVRVTGEDYGAALKQVDFQRQTEQARQEINRWVEEKTNDKIKDLIEPGVLGQDTRLVLTNAIYFKSAWLEAFTKGATKDEAFHVTADNAVKVPMMHRVDQMAYLDGGTFQAVAIPYNGFDLSMVVLLPKELNGLPELEKSLAAGQLDGKLRKMGFARVDLKLPRFKTTSEFKLRDVLGDMGMRLAFSDRADFSGMTSAEKLQISQVIHKAFVDVNEEGTEAAAATAVVMRVTSAPIVTEPVNFHADRPFTFLIRDNRTGSILFAGRVANPKG